MSATEPPRAARLALAAWLVLGALGCGSDDPVVRGRQVYAANCTACHHVDPTLDGTMGPAIAGSSHELLTARVLGAAYPPGYTPKRDTALMLRLPHLRAQIDDLAAYLGKGAPVR